MLSAEFGTILAGLIVAVLIVIAILAAPQLIAVLRGQIDTNAAYYQIPLGQRIEYGAAYLALVVFLGTMLYALNTEFGLH